MERNVSFNLHYLLDYVNKLLFSRTIRITYTDLRSSTGPDGQNKPHQNQWLVPGDNPGLSVYSVTERRSYSELGSSPGPFSGTIISQSS